MKKIFWHVVDHKGKNVYGKLGLLTRRYARECIDRLNKEMFEPWNDDIAYPIHLEREEFMLVSRKVVR